MDGTIEQGLRRFATGDLSARRRLVVGSSGTAQDSDLGQLYTANDGVSVHYTSVTSALADCRSGYDDQIDIASNFSTALTAAELLSAETKGVHIRYLGPRIGHTGSYVTRKATATLPASTLGSLFTVTGKIKLLAIIGEVTTVIQTQTCNTKIVANPTVGADVDLCATNDITADAVGTQYNITGTFANAMVATTSGAAVWQADPTLVLPGTIDLSTDATNTGSVKWTCIWEPVDPGARVISA